MGKFDAEIRSIVGKTAQGMIDPHEVSALVHELAADLRRNILSSDMPGGVKNALTNSISVSVGATGGVVSVSAMRPSIYAPVGLYGSVDLAIIYDSRKRIKSSAIYYNNDTGDFIPIGRIEGFARPYSTNYLANTAGGFMAKHPDCIVTVSK